MTFVKIYEAVCTKLNKEFPNIHLTKMQGSNIERPAFFIELFPIQTMIQGLYDHEKKMNIHIKYDQENTTMEENLQMAERLQDLFSNGLQIEDRNFVVGQMNMYLENHTLAFSFELEWTDPIKNTEIKKQYDYMEQLIIEEGI